MSVYILHFDTPLKHAKHYVGYASQVVLRIEHHRNGTGARLTQVIREQGIGFQVAKVFTGTKYDRVFERKLKRTKNISRYCPICSGDHARRYHPSSPPSSPAKRSDYPACAYCEYNPCNDQDPQKVDYCPASEFPQKRSNADEST